MMGESVPDCAPLMVQEKKGCSMGMQSRTSLRILGGHGIDFTPISER